MCRFPNFGGFFRIYSYHHPLYRFTIKIITGTTLRQYVKHLIWFDDLIASQNIHPSPKECIWKDTSSRSQHNHLSITVG